MKEQGFDAVEINAAGNNIGQAFFSRQRNHREDEYGPQSFENRARFVGEIVAGIKEACGSDFPVQILINGIEENDIELGEASLSTTVEENCEICKVLKIMVRIPCMFVWASSECMSISLRPIYTSRVMESKEPPPTGRSLTSPGISRASCWPIIPAAA